MNFDNRAFLVGVEDEGSVGVLIAIEVGEGQTVSFEFFRQIPEGLLDVDDGVADMQTLRRLDVGGDGRGRLLSLQRISLGEKLGGIRALDGQREVAGGVGAEGVGRVEEDEFAARAHVPREGVEAFFCRVNPFELLADVEGEQFFLTSWVLSMEGSGKRLEQSFAVRDEGGEGDFFSRSCIEGRAAFAVHRVYAARVGDSEAAEADHVLIDAPPLRDDGVVEVGGLFENAVITILFLVFVGEIKTPLRSLRFLPVPSVETACERGACTAFDAQQGVTAVGHALTVGVVGFDAMVFDEEPRHGSLDGTFLVFVAGGLCRERGFFDRVLLRCRMDGRCEGQVVRDRRNGSEQEDGCEGECMDFLHGMNLLFDGSAYTLLFPVCKMVREVAARLRLGCCLSVDKPSGIC